MGRPQSGLGMAFAVASHLVAGLAVGAFIGFLLDRWLGTSPWLFVVFFFVGAIAGMLNVYRTAVGLGMAAGYRPVPSPTEAERAVSGPTGVKRKEEPGRKGGTRRGQSS